jgi:branched-chain amino acid aminotransferase
VSVFDRGFLYGDSVFETLRTYGGRPFALIQHVDRLAQSARKVFIDLPVDAPTLCAEIAAACEQVRREQVQQGAAELESARPTELYIRLMVTRGVGALGLDPGLATDPLRVLIVTRLSPPPPEVYEKGISVVSYRVARLADHTEASGAKLGNYLVAVLATRKAAAAHAKEALIVDGAERVLEGATSNVFWVQADELRTPGLDAGILDGITRQHVLQVAAQLGKKVRLETPTLSDLVAAREVFISSSVRELVPVVEVDGKRIGNGVPGPVTLELLAAFRAHCARQP